jgi:hypothetical protein
MNLSETIESAIRKCLIQINTNDHPTRITTEPYHTQEIAADVCTIDTRLMYCRILEELLRVQQTLIENGIRHEEKEIQKNLCSQKVESAKEVRFGTGREVSQEMED